MQPASYAYSSIKTTGDGFSRAGSTPNGTEPPEGTQGGGLSQAAPTPEIPELLPGYSNANSPIPGLYLPFGIPIEGTQGRATILSPLSCDSLLGIFSGGEWQLTRKEPGLSLTGAQTLALLEKGDQQLFVLASQFSHPITVTNPIDAPLITPTQELEAGPATTPQPGREYCVAVLQKVDRQAVHSQGQVETDGDAEVFPSGCSVTDDKVLLLLYYQGPGPLLAALNIQFPAKMGEHILNESDQLSLQLSPTGPKYFDLLDQQAQLMTDPESDWTPPGEQYTRLDGYTSTVTLTSLDPLVGKVDLNGLTTEASPEPQSFAAGFACTPPEGKSAEMVDLRPIERPTISLGLDLQYDLGPAEQVGITEAGAVNLHGMLQATDPDNYQGQWEATGRGSFTDYGSDFKLCTNTWTGKQSFWVKGYHSTSTLELTFTPASAPEVQFENSCGLQNRDPGYLPLSVGQLRNGSNLELAWPPEAPGNARQTVDGHLQGSTADYGTWTAVFEP